MGKKVRNKLLRISVWRGSLPQTRVTFIRRNSGDKFYYPTNSSLERLEQHLSGALIYLAQDGILILRRP